MIHLLWCTIRPELFLSSYNQWILRSKNPETIKTKVCVNSNEHKKFLESKLPNLEVYVTDKPNRVGVAYPSYYLSSRVEGVDSDVVIFASDDFLPPKNWDDYIIKSLEGKVGCLMVNDGYQALDFSNMAEPVFSIPIMTYSALVKMNKVIYNPAYNHLCSDAELYLNAKELDLVIDNRSTDKDYTFEHFHWSIGKRQPDNFDQSYYSKFENDKNIWEKRKKMTLEKRILVEL